MLNLINFKKQMSVGGKVTWVSDLTTEFLWCYELTAGAEHIWTYLSDTSRLNREMGVAPRTQIEKDGKVFVSSKMLGLGQAWIEQPWTWIAGETLMSIRNYSKGIAKTMQSVFYIDSQTHSDKRLVYIYFGWKPKNAFWNLFLKATESILKTGFGKALQKIDQAPPQVTEKASAQIFNIPKPAHSREIMSAIDNQKNKLLELGLDAESVEHLIDLVKNGDDLDIEPLRALPIAREQKLDERKFLRTCLHATRTGLLNMSWDVVCPHCRGSRYSAQSLGDLPASANCDICEVEFTTDDDNSIEVLFHVHPSVREMTVKLYCAAEPAKKTHIKLQQQIAAGKSFTNTLRFKKGFYRARMIGQGGEVLFQVDDSHGERALCVPSLNLHSDDVKKINSTFEFVFQNETNDTKTIILEQCAWNQQSLKPSQVFALSEFRDLFSQEYLRSNVKLYLGEQTILFTDIVGSTGFYQKVGDATAFAEVRSHFQEVFGEIKKHHGVVVKTIGDSVMASFASASDALAAAVRIQEKFYQDRADTFIRLRISVHSGPVIAVQLNTGIDYFGNTVNLAAKIQGCAGAGEIALSERIYKEYESMHLKNSPFQKRKNMRDGVSSDVYVLQSETIASTFLESA